MSKPIYVRNDTSPDLKIGDVFELDNHQIWYYLGTGGYLRSDNFEWSRDKPSGKILTIWNSIKAYYSGQEPRCREAGTLPALEAGMTILDCYGQWWLLSTTTENDWSRKWALSHMGSCATTHRYDSLEKISSSPWIQKIYASVEDWIKGEKSETV